MDDNKLTRKEFFKRIALMSTSVTGGTLFLSACGGPGRAKTDHLEQMPDSARYPASEMNTIEKTRPEGCNNITELTADQKSVREAQHFTINSPFKKRYCGNCIYYKSPEPRSGTPCGTCSVIPGTVNPGGYCDSWKSEFNS